MAITKYAKLHATCLAYRDQEPLKFKALVETMEDFYRQLCIHSGFIDLFTKHMQKAATSLDTEEQQKVRNRFERFIPKIRSFLWNLSSAVDDFSTIIHGDAWKNNIMFKYDENSNPETPIDICLIDFQVSRLASPMLDMASFFYTCGSKEVLDDMPNYLKHYYGTLSNQIQKLGSDPEKVYPFSVMMEHWKKFAAYGLLVRTCAISIMLGKKEQRMNALEDCNIKDLFDYEISDIVKYNDFCKHTIIHFVKNHLI